MTIDQKTERMCVQVLEILVKEAVNVTLKPNSLREVIAQRLVAGLNLLHGREEATMKAWLKDYNDMERGVSNEQLQIKALENEIDRLRESLRSSHSKMVQP